MTARKDWLKQRRVKMDIDNEVEFCCVCSVNIASMTVHAKLRSGKYDYDVCYGCSEGFLRTCRKSSFGSRKGLLLITNIDSYLKNFVNPEKIEAVMIMDGKEI